MRNPAACGDGADDGFDLCTGTARYSPDHPKRQPNHAWIAVYRVDPGRRRRLLSEMDSAARCGERYGVDRDDLAGWRQDVASLTADPTIDEPDLQLAFGAVKRFKRALVRRAEEAERNQPARWLLPRAEGLITRMRDTVTLVGPFITCLDPDPPEEHARGAA